MLADGRPDRSPDPPDPEMDPRIDPQAEESARSGSEDPHHHRHHPYLIDAEEDRWKWRARIRRDRRKLFFYRIGVAVLGLLLVIAAAVTGPLPGPGGIPLFLLGLAVWASEFEWAQNLMLWFKVQFRRYRGLSRGWRITFWGAVVLCAVTAFYVGMLIYGIPPWLPASARERLQILPGLE